MTRAIFAALPALFIAAPALADTYEFDKSHTKILFFINHLGFSDTIGEFTGYDGNFTFDQNAPEKSSVDVTLKPSGIRTSSESVAWSAVVAMSHTINLEENVNNIRSCVLSPGDVHTPLMNQRPMAISAETGAAPAVTSTAYESLPGLAFP